MLNMQIEGIEIRNYRVLRHVTIKNLSRLTAFVGANGTGKSTIFDVFSFLKDSLTHNVAVAINKRGGFRELVSRDEKGPITIALKFRETSGRLATYELSIASDGGLPVVEREILKLRQGQRGKPLHVFDFSRGKGSAIANEATGWLPNAVEDRCEYALDGPSILALKSLGQFKGVIAEFRDFIEQWHIFDFNAAAAMPAYGIADSSEHLSARGGNLAQVAKFICENHPNQFLKIIEALKRRVPSVENVDFRVTEDGRLILRFHDSAFKDPFTAGNISEGTLKIFAYLVLLYDISPFPVLILEEPENELYPALLLELIEEFRDYARRGGQVFISTHSPYLLNGFDLKEIFWLSKERGFSKIQHASDSDLLRSLVREGDMPGSLWKQGLFEAMGRQ